MENYIGLKNTPGSRANVIFQPTSRVMNAYPRISVCTPGSGVTTLINSSRNAVGAGRRG